MNRPAYNPQQVIKDSLEKGSSQEVISRNIAMEIRSGKDPKQEAAIAYSEAERTTGEKK